MKEVSSTTEPGVDLVLAEASTEALLDAIIQLTHRIHDLQRFPKDQRAPFVDDLRAQRNLARVELVRRDERLQLLEATRLTVVPA